MSENRRGGLNESQSSEFVNLLKEKEVSKPIGIKLKFPEFPPSMREEIFVLVPKFAVLTRFKVFLDGKFLVEGFTSRTKPEFVKFIEEKRGQSFTVLGADRHAVAHLGPDVTSRCSYILTNG